MDQERVGDFETVDARRLRKSPEAVRNIEAALAEACRVAPEGKAIRVRFETPGMADSFRNAIQRRARLRGYRAYTESASNNSLLVWIDLHPTMATRRG